MALPGLSKKVRETLGTPLYRLKTGIAEVIRALHVVLHLDSPRAAEEQTDHNYETIARATTDRLARDLPLSEIELDELWSFIGQKGGYQTTEEQSDPCTAEGSSERWGCMSIDRASRFVVSWANGPREETLAENVIATTRLRTAGQVGIPYVTNGWKPYEETVRTTCRDREPSGIRPGWDILRPTEGTRLTQAAKYRKGRRLIRVEVRATTGEPVEQRYPVHIERFNGVLRDRLGCLTRKTHAFVKEIALWDALFSLTLFEHNWIRPHIALRLRLPQPVNGRRYDQRTPAMAIGLTDHAWIWSALLMKRGKLH